MFIVALDVAKRKSYTVIYQDARCLWEGVITHNQTGFAFLRQHILQLPQRPEVVFEATGVYSRPVETFCQTNNLPYILMNPLLAKKQAEQLTLRRHKTDRHDAHQLALSQLEKNREPKLIQEKRYQTMQDWARFYQEIGDQIQPLQTHLHNNLQLVFPELEDAFSSNMTPYALSLIQRFPHPNLVLKISPSQLKESLREATPKKMSEARAQKKAEEFIALALEAYPSVDEDSVPCQKTRYYAQELQALLETKDALKTQLIEDARLFDEHEWFSSIPGIGELTSALLIGELGDIRRFKTSNKLNAFVGIDLKIHESGDDFQPARINKRGNSKARKILFYTIRNMVRQQKAAPNHIVDYYYKLKKQPIPKKDKVAVVACMNKLLKCLHSMVRHQTKYDYAHTDSKVPMVLL